MKTEASPDLTMVSAAGGFIVVGYILIEAYISCLSIYTTMRNMGEDRSKIDDRSKSKTTPAPSDSLMIDKNYLHKDYEQEKNGGNNTPKLDLSQKRIT